MYSSEGRVAPVPDPRTLNHFRRESVIGREGGRMTQLGT